MKFLNDILLRDATYHQLLRAVNGGRLPLAATGLSRIHKAALAAALNTHTERKIVLLTPDESSANQLCDDFRSMGLTALNFPSRDYNLTDLAGFSREYEQKRIDTLSRVLDGAFDVLTLSVDAAIQYTVPPAVLRQSRQTVKMEEALDLSAFEAQLVAAGYVRCDPVEGKGQFAVRGNLLDVFPPDS
ncbi:MAG: transcription-repair coupling factor, partial [Clostridia bacterium]|nr:transcription-repair coupling factor [Clostridia bacterium]